MLLYLQNIVKREVNTRSAKDRRFKVTKLIVSYVGSSSI